MKYDVIFECGHEGIVDIVGKGAYREWKVEQYKKQLCPECIAAEIEKKNKAAQEEAKEQGLVDLIGTEKQVGWASSIRLEKFEEIESMRIEKGINTIVATGYRAAMERYKEDKEEINEFAEKTKGELNDVFDSMVLYLQGQVKASWWIDNRIGKYYLGCAYHDIMYTYMDKVLGVGAVEEEVKLAPSEMLHPGIVKIKESGNEMQLTSIKDEDLKKIVKDLGMTWNGDAWVRKLDNFTGKYQDRAAELANKLLREGFVVSVQDPEVREKAVTGEFIPECKRWVKQVVGKPYFAISWGRRDDELYTKAKSLPNAKWVSRFIKVPVEFCDEVMDFAELNDFKFSDLANEMIISYKKQLEDAFIVEPAEPDDTNREDSLKKILESSGAIIDDLVDEG